MIRLALAAACLTLTACAPTLTTYGPAGLNDRSVGYSDIRIEEARWRVSFVGGPDLSRNQTERFALRRAAELTVQNGYDWFEVVARNADVEGSNRSPVSVGGSVGTSVGSGGFRASGVGIGVSINPSAERRTEVTLEILARRGEMPEAAPDAYDARALLAISGPAI